jgi:MFS superfamily sulfate permease-like transporter
MLLFVPGLLQNLPQPTLAAVVIAAALSLADIRATTKLWRQRRSEWLVFLVAFLGVAILGVLQGIAVAVLLSVFNVFRRSWWSYRARLGRVPDVAGYHDVTLRPGAEELEGLILFRFDGPLFFANARGFAEDIRALARHDPPPRWIVLAAEPITDVDPTAAEVLAKVNQELRDAGVRMVVAELKDPVRAKLQHYEPSRVIDDSVVFGTLDEAVAAYVAAFPEAEWRPTDVDRPRTERDAR